MGFRTSIQNINFIAHLIEENVYAFLQQSIFSNEMLLTNVFPIPANSRITTYTYNVETREEGIYRMTRLTKNNAAGNTSTGIWSVVYNADNRPVSFTKTEGDQTTLIECDYDYMGRRYMKKVTVNGAITLHHRYIYRGYLQIACVDLTRNGHPALWLTMWDPSEPVATRPLAIQKNATWYSYGHDLTKNVTELYQTNGTIATVYDYTPYGAVTSTGTDQAFQWSSEVYDAELGMVYYNYRHYNPIDGRWINRDPIAEQGGRNLYLFIQNNSLFWFDHLGNGAQPLSGGIASGSGFISGYSPLKPYNHVSKAPRNSSLKDSSTYMTGMTPGTAMLPRISGSANPCRKCPKDAAKTRLTKPNSNCCEYRTKQQKSSHKPKSNGCGPEILPVWDSFNFVGTTVSFLPACNAHDICYDTCGSSKLSCDISFLQNMLQACRQAMLAPIFQSECAIYAHAYFGAVTLPAIVLNPLDLDPYEIAQDNACEWRLCN